METISEDFGKTWIALSKFLTIVLHHRFPQMYQLYFLTFILHFFKVGSLWNQGSDSSTVPLHCRKKETKFRRTFGWACRSGGRRPRVYRGTLPPCPTCRAPCHIVCGTIPPCPACGAHAFHRHYWRHILERAVQ